MRRAIHPAELVAAGVALSLTVAAVNSAMDRAGLTSPRDDVVVAETEAPEVAPRRPGPGVGDSSTHAAVLGERFTPLPTVETADPTPERVPTLDPRNRLYSQDPASLPDDVVTSPAPTGSVSRPAPASPSTSPTASRTSSEPAPSVPPTSAPTTSSPAPSPTTPATATDPAPTEPEPTQTAAVDVETPGSTAVVDPAGEPTSDPTGGALTDRG